MVHASEGIKMSKRAFGYSDRSGFRYRIEDLVEEYVDGSPSGLLVGRDELDIDHEQYRVGEAETNDKQSLDNPRPDQALTSSRGLGS